MGSAVTGANEADYHFRGVVKDRDFKVDRWVDVRAVKEGDICGKCGEGEVSVWKAIQLTSGEMPTSDFGLRIGLQYADGIGAA